MGSGTMQGLLGVSNPYLSACPETEVNGSVGPPGFCGSIAVGLRGVRLGTPGRNQEVVPIVHLPNNKVGRPQYLLGLDPVLVGVPSGGTGGGMEDQVTGFNPLVAGASTPFVPVAVEENMPPPPPLEAQTPAIVDWGYREA